MSWLDGLILAALAALAFLALRRLSNDRKRGGGCCGSCAGCPMAGKCSKEEEKTK